MHDVIIIGSGPAGLSAAIYAVRAGLDVLVLEKNFMSGGQVLNTYEVDNYLGMPGISGFDMGMQFRAHADKLGVVFQNAEVLSIEDKGEVKVVITRKETYETKALILATGAQHAHLGVPGEEELSGRGVSYCATCDGAFYKDRTAAVIGGGDVALEDAIYLARVCKKVYVIHRRDEFRGAKILQDNLMSMSNVEILYSHVAVEIAGESSVECLKVKNVKDDTEKEIALDGVFIAVGIHPDTNLVKDMVTLDEGGYVVAGEDGVTSVPGIFAAGDVRKKSLRQIVTAVADGANAAISVEKYLKSSIK